MGRPPPMQKLPRQHIAATTIQNWYRKRKETIARTRYNLRSRRISSTPDILRNEDISNEVLISSLDDDRVRTDISEQELISHILDVELPPEQLELSTDPCNPHNEAMLNTGPRAPLFEYPYVNCDFNKVYDFSNVLPLCSTPKAHHKPKNQN